ncbi:putative bifunctional diguanylate cyclase/phosphodiesterase [Acholeplasma laidlawii]|uniref:putative bifunctional diguanylate cyclase/phosphodiesterase n=1 Tax=Acholeplasma laidlawii TaxID=2148 RepID=UPI0018C28874|nr:EAL domain-containing protein [Acholeplasma laidlawii]
MVYTIYANEVAAIIPTSDFNKAYEIGLNLLNKMADSIAIDRYQIGILLNGSIVQYPLHIKDSNDAIKNSAMILDQTINDFGLHEYNDEMERKSRLQGELVSELLHAIKENEFHLVYQPKISLDGSEQLSVEALLRWHHPYKGTISPMVFIPVAEESGLINEITKTVIRNVIEQTLLWKEKGLDVKTSINISHRDFNHKDFLTYIQKSMAECQIDPSFIEFEITERGVLERNDNIIKLFTNLRDMGIKISIDDFGTGYNSLIHLVQVPMDYLKVDRSFIINITKPKYQKRIQRLISLAHDLDIKVIAEGVETKEQLDFLKDMNCDIVQGYYLSKPLEADALEAFYKNRV